VEGGGQLVLGAAYGPSGDPGCRCSRGSSGTPELTVDSNQVIELAVDYYLVAPAAVIGMYVAAARLAAASLPLIAAELMAKLDQSRMEDREERVASLVRPPLLAARS
jgi:hypothetical protein